MHLVHIIFCVSVLVVVCKIISLSGSLSIDTPINDEDSRGSIDLGRRHFPSDPGHQFSEIITHVGSSGTGLMNKYFYRFKNIQIDQGRLKFYYDEKNFTPPSEDHWVDIVSCNATSPRHPTMLVVKGDAQPIRWYVLMLCSLAFTFEHYYRTMCLLIQALYPNRLHSSRS